MKKSNKRIPAISLILLLATIATTLLFQDTGKADPLLKQAQTTQKAPIPNNTGFHFLALGDTGSGVSFQTDIAKQMLQLHQKTPFPFILLLGDIVYPSGEWEKLGTKRYKNVYAPLFKKGVKIRPTLGNHDVRYGYKKGTTQYYDMPSRSYQFSHQNVDFFAVDTNIIKKPEQQQWLDKALSKSKAQWKVIYGHHPVYSSGVHQSSKSLIKVLEPLLVKHHVDFYLAGHDHDYERFRPIKGVVHIVSGGGGAYLRDFKKTENNSFIRRKKHHFIHFAVQGDKISYQAIDKTGQVIDSETYTK